MCGLFYYSDIIIPWSRAVEFGSGQSKALTSNLKRFDVETMGVHNRSCRGHGPRFDGRATRECIPSPSRVARAQNIYVKGQATARPTTDLRESPPRDLLRVVHQRQVGKQRIITQRDVISLSKWDPFVKRSWYSRLTVLKSGSRVKMILEPWVLREDQMFEPTKKQ
jgi:hypothetical protein